MGVKRYSFENEIQFISTLNPYFWPVKSISFVEKKRFSSVFAEKDSLKSTILGILVKNFPKILECLKKDVILQNNLLQTIESDGTTCEFIQQIKV